MSSSEGPIRKKLYQKVHERRANAQEEMSAAADTTDTPPAEIGSSAPAQPGNSCSRRNARNNAARREARRNGNNAENCHNASEGNKFKGTVKEMNGRVFFNVMVKPKTRTNSLELSMNWTVM
jgi:hypothetical protein